MQAGLKPGDHVAISFSLHTNHSGQPRAGWVDADGMLKVGGVAPSAGMVRAILSRPWRQHGGDLWTMRAGDLAATLADGTAVTLYRQDRGVWIYLAAEKEYETIMDAAIAMTPAQ